MRARWLLPVSSGSRPQGQRGALRPPAASLQHRPATDLLPPGTGKPLATAERPSSMAIGGCGCGAHPQGRRRHAASRRAPLPAGRLSPVRGGGRRTSGNSTEVNPKQGRGAAARSPPRALHNDGSGWAGLGSAPLRWALAPGGGTGAARPPPALPALPEPPPLAPSAAERRTISGAMGSRERVRHTTRIPPTPGGAALSRPGPGAAPAHSPPAVEGGRSGGAGRAPSGALGSSRGCPQPARPLQRHRPLGAAIGGRAAPPARRERP